MSFGGFTIYMVDRGTGGTFTDGSQPKGHLLGDVRAIGLEWCVDTAGVYFELGMGRCFCANIAIPER